jgi:hypothetical protein
MNLGAFFTAPGAAKNRAIRLNKILAGFACQNFIPLLSLAQSIPLQAGNPHDVM